MEDASLDFDGDSGVVGTLKSGEASLHFDVKGQASGGPPGRARASGGPHKAAVVRCGLTRRAGVDAMDERGAPAAFIRRRPRLAPRLPSHRRGGVATPSSSLRAVIADAAQRRDAMGARWREHSSRLVIASRSCEASPAPLPLPPVREGGGLPQIDRIGAGIGARPAGGRRGV